MQGLSTSVSGPSNEADQTNLLGRRLEALHLDLEELARSDPSLLSDLQRGCATCKSREVCALELAHPSPDAAWGAWREYCPNAIKLNELRVRQAMQSNPQFLRSLTERLKS